MASIVCDHGSYEEWKKDVPVAGRDDVHYSLTTMGQGFICVYYDGMEHVWTGSNMPASFLVDFPKASIVARIRWT